MAEFLGQREYVWVPIFCDLVLLGYPTCFVFLSLLRLVDITSQHLYHNIIGFFWVSFFRLHEMQLLCKQLAKSLEADVATAQDDTHIPALGPGLLLNTPPELFVEQDHGKRHGRARLDDHLEPLQQ